MQTLWAASSGTPIFPLEQRTFHLFFNLRTSHTRRELVLRGRYGDGHILHGWRPGILGRRWR